MVRRRFFLIGLVAGLGTLATLFVAYILPPIYRSEARILVESQQIPDELARSTVTASAVERLEGIRQRLMARDNLVQLIDRLGLFANRPDMTLTEKIEKLRRATIIIPSTVAGARGQVLSTISIAIILGDPYQAAATVNEYVTIVLEQNARVRTKQATETLAFFKQETERLQKAVQGIEQEISDFKRANEDALPENLEFRHNALAQITETRLTIDQSIFQLEEQRDLLESRLAELRLAQSSPAGSDRGELRELESRLAQLRTVYSDSHREIQALLARTEALQNTAPGTSTGNQAETRAQQRSQLERRIASLGDQIILLEDRKTELIGSRSRIEESIQRTPDVEIQLNAYDRQLEDIQDQLADITRKRAEAETGERLEVNQQAERFEVIESALVPEGPISPNRKKIAIMGTAASLGIGFGLAMLLELLFPAIRSAAQMERQLNLQPVVSIPLIRTRRERRMRWVRSVFVLLLLGVAVPASVYTFDQRVMPLQKVGEKIVEKTGLSEFVRLVEARF